MTRRPARVTQAEITRILAGARKAGIDMGIVVTVGEVRFVPVDSMPPDQKLTALDEWKAKRDARKAP